MSGWLGDKINDIVGGVKNVVEAVTGGIQDAFDTLVEAVQDANEYFSTLLEDTWNGVLSFAGIRAMGDEEVEVHGRSFFPVLKPGGNWLMDWVLTARLEHVPLRVVRSQQQLTGLAAKFNRMAEESGLSNTPATLLSRGKIANSDFEAAIASDLGLVHGCRVLHVGEGLTSPFTLLFPWLSGKRQMDATTFEIRNTEGLAVPDGWRAFFVSSTLDTTTNQLVARYGLARGRLKVPFDTPTTLIEERFPAPANFESGVFVQIVMYVKKGADGGPSGDPAWWLYDPRTWRHPTLQPEPLATVEAPLPTFPLMTGTVYNPRFLADSTDPSDMLAFEKTKAGLSAIGISAETLTEKLKANPDIHKIYGIRLVFGVDPNTENPGVHRYLARFFHVLAMGARTADLLDEDGKAVKLRLDFAGTPKSPKASAPVPVFPEGPGEPGETDGVETHLVHALEGTDYWTLERMQLSMDRVSTRVKPAGPELADPFAVTLSITGNDLTIIEGIGNGRVREVVARNLVHIHSTGWGPARHLALSEVAGNPGERAFFIPLVMKIANTLPLSEKGAFFEETVRLDVKAREVHEIPWYQTEDFQELATGFVIAFSLINPLGGGLVALIEQGMMEVATHVLKMAIIGTLAKKGFDWAADKWGAEWAMVLAVATLVAGGASKGSLFKIPKVDALMFAAQSGFQAVDEALLSEMEGVAKAKETFQTDAAKKLQELEKKRQELLHFPAATLFKRHTRGDLRPRPNPMGPREYYGWVHQTNPGAFGIEMLHREFDPVY